MRIDTISYIVRTDDDLELQDSTYSDPFSGSIVTGDMAHLVNKRTEHVAHTIEDRTIRNEGLLLPFRIEQADSVFGLLLLCFLFFAHIYNGGFSFLKENFSLLFTSERTARLHRQTTVKEILYGYFLIFQAIVLISICAYDVFIEFASPTESTQKPVVVILSFIILITLFFGVKDIIYKILGSIFDIQRLMTYWRRTYIITLEILGILYFIPTLLLVYADFYHVQIIVFMLLLFLIVQIILFYQIIIFFIGEKFNFLYLIAYLCTFEILPYIFLLIGLVYLYRIDVFNILWL